MSSSDLPKLLKISAVKKPWIDNIYLMALKSSLIILVGLTMVCFNEKMMISYSCIRCFMPKLHNIFWIVSSKQGGSKRHLQLSVVPVTRTDERTMGSICRGVFATPFATIDAFPTVRTWAGTVNGVARSAILATAAFLALQTIFAVRALSLTLQKRASKSVRSGYNGIWYKVKDSGFWNLKPDTLETFNPVLCITR